MRIRFMFCKFVVTASYAGLSPILPGTSGTMVALVISWTLSKFCPEVTSPMSWSLLILLTTIVGVWASNKALEWNMSPVVDAVSHTAIVTGDQDHREPPKNDPSAIVIDEVAGYFISILGLASTGFNNEALLIGFFFFRLFDMTKLWPIYKLENLPRGYGIMADDILAGIFANLATRLVLWCLA